MMKDVYQECPQFENEKYKLRFLSEHDCSDLLNVYSDKEAVRFFNSDNCGGDDFYYATASRMKEAIDYWFFEYDRKGFVRWSIINKHENEVIGTIELFQRNAKDYFTKCGLLRLDIRSDYEKAEEIERLLSLIIAPAFDLFQCDKIATKAIPAAVERIGALEKLGFSQTEEKLIGHDGTEYVSYFVLEREAENNFRYKKATAVDIEELTSSRIQVLRTVFQIDENKDITEIEKASYKYYQEALDNETHTAYLVYDGEKVIGAGGICYYQVMPMPYDLTGKRAYIMNMYTAPQYRGRGIASKVVALLLEDAKQRGASIISLSATELGKPVYEKCGFAVDTDTMVYGH